MFIVLCPQKSIHHSYLNMAHGRKEITVCVCDCFFFLLNELTKVAFDKPLITHCSP